MPSNIGAQLVKSLSFEVEATPQDNAVEVKKTTNMTPVNVKVRVRKKDDGTSLMRKGILSVPRTDLPDRPIEKLRLASSDQTIMSFNMVLEADLEKRVERKPKKNFFGICLGVQEDDDDTQYLPSAASTIDQDCRSDTGVMKLRNVRPVVKTVTDDAISSNSKKDKIFGKCKPGGCLDPPFGEDRYAYQPNPLRAKAPATALDDAQNIDFQNQPTDKISLKHKKKVEPGTEKAPAEQDKSILSLYQGESGVAIEDNDSESIITYPTGVSSSALVDEKNGKNVARRASGARNSRKSFNEFSSNEYFSPPRASRDSSKSDREKNSLTKELLSPRDNKTVSPPRFRHSVEKSGSKDVFGLNSSGVEDENNVKGEKSGIQPDSSVQKSFLRTTSEGLISEMFGDIEHDDLDYNNKTWNKTPTTAGIAGATGVAAAGLVGIGLIASAKKEAVKSDENPFSEDISNVDKTIQLERTLVDNSSNHASSMVEYKNRINSLENPSNLVTQGDEISDQTRMSEKYIDKVTPSGNETQGRDVSSREIKITGDPGKTSSQTGQLINQNVGGQLASTGMEIIGDTQRNPLKYQMYDNINEHHGPVENDLVIDSPQVDLRGSNTRSTKGNEIHISSKNSRSTEIERGSVNNQKTIEQNADSESRAITISFGPENGSQSINQHTRDTSNSGILDSFASSGTTTRIGSETGYSQKSNEIYKTPENKTTADYEDFSPIRRVMSDGMEKSDSRAGNRSGGYDRGFTSTKSTSTVKTSNELETSELSFRNLAPNELKSNESTQDEYNTLPLTPTNAYTTGSQASTIKGGHVSKESIPSETYRRTGKDLENVDLKNVQQYLDQGMNRGSKSDTLTAKSVEESRLPLRSIRTARDDESESWPKKNDASVESDIIKSPSDIISQYRENKNLNHSPVIGVDIQPTESTLKQAGRKLDDDWEQWGSEGNNEGQLSSSVRVSPRDSSGKHRDNSNFVADDTRSRTVRSGTNHSRESVFLNLAFQTYLDENQPTVRTLNSSQDQDENNVVLVKSLLRAQDKTGITVPLDSKNVMNIVIKPAPPAQRNISRTPKSISKFDSGKSDYSNSTVSLKDVASNPHAALSSIFHQELVPLQSIIKSLKDEIDALAAQQMLLRNRLEIGATKSKPFVAKKCSCPKKSLYKHNN